MLSGQSLTTMTPMSTPATRMRTGRTPLLSSSRMRSTRSLAGIASRVTWRTACGICRRASRRDGYLVRSMRDDGQELKGNRVKRTRKLTSNGQHAGTYKRKVGAR